MWNPKNVEKQLDGVQGRQPLKSKEKPFTQKVQPVVKDQKLVLKHAKIMNTLPPKDVLHFARLCFKEVLNDATADVVTKMTELKQSKPDAKKSKFPPGLSSQEMFKLGPMNDTDKAQSHTFRTVRQYKQNLSISSSKRRCTAEPKRLQVVLPTSGPKLSRKRSKRIAAKKNIL
ncbi:hypothetical protein ACOMHN_016304 [Nucella lapillus]